MLVFSCSFTQLHAVPCSMKMLESCFPCCFMQLHAVPCCLMQFHAAKAGSSHIFHAVSCCFMQHENVQVMFFMLFHAVPCSSMLFHAVPCYSPKSGETDTDTKHANFDWCILGHGEYSCFCVKLHVLQNFLCHF
jgi:hypothetical protein